MKPTDLRDHFAGLAMQQIMATYEAKDSIDHAIIAEEAYTMADAMMAERSPQGTPSGLGDPIEALELRPATTTALKGGGVHTVRQLMDKGEIGILKLPGLGKVSIDDIKQMLHRLGYGPLPLR